MLCPFSARHGFSLLLILLSPQYLHDLGLGQWGIEGGVDVVVEDTLAVQVNPLSLHFSIGDSSRLGDFIRVELTQSERNQGF